MKPQYSSAVRGQKDLPTINSKWGTGNSQVKGWVSAKVQICILHSVIWCLRGPRKKWVSSLIADGAALQKLQS